MSSIKSKANRKFKQTSPHVCFLNYNTVCMYSKYIIIRRTVLSNGHHDHIFFPCCKFLMYFLTLSPGICTGDVNNEKRTSWILHSGSSHCTARRHKGSMINAVLLQEENARVELYYSVFACGATVEFACAFLRRKGGNRF